MGQCEPSVINNCAFSWHNTSITWLVPCGCVLCVSILGEGHAFLCKLHQVLQSLGAWCTRTGSERTGSPLLCWALIRRLFLDQIGFCSHSWRFLDWSNFKRLDFFPLKYYKETLRNSIHIFNKQNIQWEIM